ncbi:MAG: hypothetical protein WAM60_00205 [Candidatus Promineifilaceae bacterium]
MLFSDVLLGTVLGAILWPIIQRVVDSTNRAILGLIIGGMIGGALAWGRLGIYIGSVIGSRFGANVTPIEQDLGLAFLAALIQTARGGVIGAIVVLSIRSISFVITGAGIGLLTSLLLSGGLRFLNQSLLHSSLSSLQITIIVLFGTFLIFAVVSGRT